MADPSEVSVRERVKQPPSPLLTASYFAPNLARALAHGFDGQVFANGAGDENEGDVEAVGAQPLQGFYAIEARQGVVGEDNIQPRVEGGVEGFGGLYPLPVQHEARSPQFTNNEFSVVGLIFDHQHPQVLGWRRPRGVWVVNRRHHYSHP